MSDVPAKNSKPLLNYIKLINQFWTLKRLHKLTSNESMLYLGLIDKCNSLNWKNPFRESERYLSKSLGISPNTIRKDRLTLVKYGMITFSLPEKASKSIEGSAVYFIVENVPTASTVAAVEYTPTASTTEAPTASTTEAQPLQNSTPTASTVAANNKPSEKNLLKPSFYKEEIQKNYTTNELQMFWDNFRRGIIYESPFKGKSFSVDDYKKYLQNYYPEEIQKLLKVAQQYDEHGIYEPMSICQMLDCFLPKERAKVETKINNMFKGCDNLLNMPKQLTLKEKMYLDKKINWEALRSSFQKVNDNPSWRKGESVFIAIKTNLEISGNWK